MDASGIAEDRDFGRWGILVAKGEGVVDDFGELGVDGWLAVAAEGDGVDFDLLPLEALQHSLKVGKDLGCGGEDGVVASVAVPTAFAIDTIEIAKFAFFGQEVDAQRCSEAATMDGSEDCFFS